MNGCPKPFSRIRVSLDQDFFRFGALNLKQALNPKPSLSNVVRALFLEGLNHKFKLANPKKELQWRLWERLLY